MLYHRDTNLSKTNNMLLICYTSTHIVAVLYNRILKFVLQVSEELGMIRIKLCNAKAISVWDINLNHVLHSKHSKYIQQMVIYVQSVN